MSPINERHLAQDDVSDYAQRFAPIHSSIPDLRAPHSRAHQTSLLSNTLPYRPQLLKTWEDKSLSDHLHGQDAADARTEALAAAVNDKDCATVLDELVQAGKLDADEVNEKLADAAEKRLQTTFPQRNSSYLRALRAMKSLIDACDNSTDQSTLLQRVKSDAYTAWFQAGGEVMA